MSIQVIILAAGMGTRLGRPHPKPLTVLNTGQSIMAQQFERVHDAFGEAARVTVVVGFKMDLVMEAFPDALFVYNEVYSETNTSKSLLKGLRSTVDGGVLWLNGDVVFDQGILESVSKYVTADESFVCVNTATVAEEEVKYTVDADGYINELSKQVVGGLGEAVGINFISSADKPKLIERLKECGDQDYFERGLELAIAGDGVRILPVDISAHNAVEVDTGEDLDRANAMYS
ncbi:MAG TPA: NTP transferase domain-containing protein [Kineosporiaceae bacterium]|nr:NTP transferase domain-containing protein [Kineosporiaceae bacterium]